MLVTVTAAIAALVVGGAVTGFVVRSRMQRQIQLHDESAIRELETRRTEAESRRTEAERAIATAQREAETIRKEAEIDAKAQLLELRRDLEREIDEQRVALTRLEERVTAREETLERTEAAIVERETEASRREQALADAEAVLHDAQARADRELERVGGMTRDEARGQILARVEEATRHEIGRAHV